MGATATIDAAGAIVATFSTKGDTESQQQTHRRTLVGTY